MYTATLVYTNFTTELKHCEKAFCKRTVESLYSTIYSIVII
jgi:hypothetical protein